jgi:hypothetical protein
MRTTTMRRGLLLLLSMFLAGLFASTVYADEGDPPGRAARLSVAEGKVSFQPSGETDWSEASVNRPVSTGDRLYTDAGARAELEVGPFAVRIAQGTDLTLANLSDQMMQMGVGQGTVRVTVYEMPEGNSVEVDTPNGALILQSAGSYRVDTAADGNSTQVTVNAGTLEISAGDLSKTLQSGQAVTLTGTGPVAAMDISVPAADDFDQWCAERDRHVENSPSAQSVGPAVPGTEDLDTNGQWTDEPDYGQVWVPANVATGWVPYRNGHWVFIEPWGWTWVEAEPWGYAPFHYGRWAHIGPVWAWVPGPVVAVPMYAPALVAFVGGPGLSVGVGVGVAWFPLGPREPFLPWYHYTPTYIRGFNGPRVGDFASFHYANRELAITAVSGEVFRGGQPVARGLMHVDPDQLARSTVIPHPEVSPTARAVYGARAVAAPPVPAARFGEMRPSTGVSGEVRTPAPALREAERPGGPPSTPAPRMFTRNAPAPTNAPFAARQDAYSSHPGRPLEPQQMDNLRSGKPAGPMRDKEVIPHSPGGSSRPSPPHEDHGRH